MLSNLPNVPAITTSRTVALIVVARFSMIPNQLSLNTDRGMITLRLAPSEKAWAIDRRQ